MKVVIAAFNQEKALVGTFSLITNLQMKLFGALMNKLHTIMSAFGLIVQCRGVMRQIVSQADV